MAHLKLGEILLKQGLVTDDQLKEAIKAQKKESGRIGEVLVKLGILSEEDLAGALGSQLNIPHATLENKILSPDLSQGLDKIVPFDFAKANFVLPIKKDGGTLTCAVADPLDLLMLDNLKMVTGSEIELMIATRAELLNAIQSFYSAARSMSVTSNLGKKEGPAAAPVPKEEDTRKKDVDPLAEKAEEAPVIKLVDLIIRQAIEQRGSDIHIEPYKDKVCLRYRIDGALYQIPPPAKHLHSAIVSRLKILSKLDIAEKRLPQDGAITFMCDTRPVDLRISTIPTIWGEKVVMRILDKAAVPLELSSLGFDPKALDRVRTTLKRPYGLFFVTGPTGSGKSTTLYAALNETIDPKKNIVTAEDPVEFKIEGINQVPVKPDIGLSFAVTLRAFLRQDPDVIMVGEVRDLETAQICVRAALTGHFVLSTLHTNDAASAVTRLMDIGIEPYLLTPSLAMVLAQRLARRLCAKCKEPVEPNPDLHGGIKFKCDLIYKAKGCDACNHTGYRGRVVLSEAMLVDDNIRELISKRANYNLIHDAARKSGMATLFEDGIRKVEEGVTSLDEILSVTTS
ncbi:MAG: ATPase, T2SS/T4P/T4SS family [Candidatus Omnitrophota bacterium]|nr:ATPase, T2SS/T4P/T4SS family [Candidatus Omnitrophota bacterium]MDZ4241220.1 ATPase, T2SS/T4P/T4SS family [Candidatus Omnitrophota bacterium]